MLIVHEFDQTLNVGGESYNVQIATVQPRKHMCYAPDPDKENTVQQLGWVDKRLTVQTALSHSVKQKLKQYWREEEQSKCRAVCAAVVLMRCCDRGEKCAEHRQVR